MGFQNPSIIEFYGVLGDGILSGERLVAEIPFLRAEGAGTLGLIDNQINYRINARVLSRPNFPDADDLADLQRITIPMTITGDAADPNVRLGCSRCAAS